MSQTNQRMLIIGPAWVGDMVMAQTLFILLKQQRPELQIDVLAPGWTLPLLQRMPEINQAMALPFGHGGLQWSERRTIGKQLHQHDYQQAIVLPHSFKSALIPFWARIPQRIGWRGECRWGLLTDCRKLDTSVYPLMIQRFAALAFPQGAKLMADLPKPKFQVIAANVTRALHNHALTMPTQPILALCPGAEFGPSKRWPENYFAEVANKKLAEGWQVWLFGSNKDYEVTEHINSLTQHRCVNLAGKTQLSEAIDLLSLAKVVLTNDSGLMHVAAALQRPLVALYGSTSPQFTPPLTDHAKILSTSISCRPCFKRTCPVQHHRCMTELLPSQVCLAVKQMSMS